MTDPGERPANREWDFESFFRKEYARLARALFLVTADPLDAEDVAQEAMVRVCERWSTVSTMSSPEGYLYRTALNLQRSRWRRMKVVARRVGEPGRRVDPVENAEARDALDRALASLPLSQRQALILTEWIGLSDTEAGNVLGIAPVSVRARISRARAALRATRSEVNTDG